MPSIRRRPHPGPGVEPLPLRTTTLLVALAVAGAAAAGIAAAQAQLPPAAARIIAHRGYSAVAPENTLAAFRAAAEAGVPRQWAEVRTTSDGDLVLLADATLDRTTNCQGLVRDQTTAAVVACDAGSWFDPQFAGETVPHLAAAMAEVAGEWWLWLADAVPAAVVAAARTAGAANRVTYVTEREADIALLRAADPGARVWLRVTTLTASAVGLAQAAGANGLAVNPGPLRGDELANAVALGLEVAVVAMPDDPALVTAVAQGITHASTTRVEPSAWALGLRFRTYPPVDLGRPMIEGQGFVSALAFGDFNRDTRTDLVVGAPLDDSAGEAAGWAGVLSGGDRFPGPLWAAPGTEEGARWGGVFTVADFNADGYDDLVMGYPLRDFGGSDSGAMWLFDGGPGGVGGLARPIGSQAPGGSRMGAALTTGDFNADGVVDLAVASPGRTVANQAGAGQVTLMPGLRGSGPVATGALVLDRSSQRMNPAVAMPGEPVRGEGLGTALAAGDFDGDGTADLAIGIPSADVGELRTAGSVIVVWLEAEAGTGYPALRGAEELAPDRGPVPGVGERTGEFGAALAAADLDQDGHDDLVIGAPGKSVNGRRGAGEVVVLYGAAGGFDARRGQVINQDTPLIPDEAESRERFGAHLALGDLNGDGYPDLVVGTPEEIAGGQPGAGAVTVVYGSAGGLRSRVALRLEPGLAMTGFPATPRQAFGQALAVADLNHDGAPDLAVGVPGRSQDGRAVGALAVAWGYHPALPGVATPTPPPATPTPSPTVTRTGTATRTPTEGPTPTAVATRRPPASLFLPFAARLLRFPGRSLPGNLAPPNPSSG